MKLFSILFLMMALSAGAYAQTATGPQIVFESESHDFGKIDKGPIAKYRFRFKNPGTDTLLITNVRASCGCTTPTWSKDPVPPGGSGYVEAAYNSQTGHGGFSKSVTVTTNTKDGIKVLYIKGEVVDPNALDPNTQSPVRLNP